MASLAIKSNKNMSFGQKIISKLGRIGAVLMFPIAVLPIAAILMRIGADVPNATAFSAAVQKLVLQSGEIVFANMPILFAIGLAFGFTQQKRGEAAFAGFVAMVLLNALLSGGGFVTLIYNSKFDAIYGKKFDSIMANNVLNGIIVGSLVAWIYNRFWNAELPKVLGFFAGRRLIPALAILATGVFAIVWAVIFPWISYAIYAISKWMSDNTSPTQPNARWVRASIMGGYGFINRLLIPFGLHHIPNNLFWFQLGSHPTGEGEKVVNGDIFIFLNGVAKDNPGGIFQAGFFPMMMFGLPALVLAFAKCAKDKTQKVKVLALYGSAAVVSFLTGITEPIEFAFMYVAPLIYLLHAVATGVFAFITGAFGIQIGFGFSAGFMDYLLSFNKSLQIIKANNFEGVSKILANPLMILPLGLLCGMTYYFGGVLLIKKFNINTPGRGEALIPDEEETVSTNDNMSLSPKAKKIVKAYGGWDNIVEFANCSTRLRYVVKDGSKVDEEALKKAGVLGVVRVSDTSIQSIIGVQAESLNLEIVAHKGEEL
ncbi:PTS glucose transporter subunit IIABC [Mycoplasmopsis pullorum]|uniref:PTS transporter subunit EIIC n=1 Tax=Mycoplasmopsis pullorum TaxID=48003 RepID=UPI001119B8BB|nr:PTS transporter subunit EIIC [Mycoplasmopsis pullorum]TNK82931.1 PTS glucose transporter subunit IIABC [Mycoplasmopsis pullorum]TNK91801.1 PTS glucose transporter subunit IIABC [Mycoplasmopsis pullorum]